MVRLGDPGTFEMSTVRKIGGGGLGIVEEVAITRSWSSQHPVGSRWARKRLNDNFRKHPEMQARFEREIAALKVMSHPAIVSCAGENLGDERFYLMPLYPQSLRDWLMKHPGGFDWTSVARFGIQIADAMQYAHDHGFKHRDLKPENVLLDNMRNPVIADWGLGYFVHKESKVLQLTQAGMGTEYYCSMEQWNTGKCDNTGDIYSLGLVLAELITGVRKDIIIGMGMQSDVIYVNTHGARIFNELIKTMTKMLAQQRIQSMSLVSRTLNSVLSLSQLPVIQ